MSGMIGHVVVVLVAAGYVGAGGKARLEGVYDNGLDVSLFG